MEEHDILSHKDFVKLSTNVKEVLVGLSWWQRHGVEWTFFLCRVALFAAGIAVFTQGGIWLRILGLVICSYAYYGIAITGTHEASHGSWAASRLNNKILGYFFADFLTAQSSVWWHKRHVLEHHVYTNITAIEAKNQNYIYPWMNKWMYFFITPYLVNFWLVYNSIINLKHSTKLLVLYLVVMIAGWAWLIWLFTFFVSLPYAVLCAFIVRSLFAPMFVHIAVFNHIGLDFPEGKMPWLPLHTKTTRNMKPHWFVTGIGGNAFVECHIEHHLFPTLSNRLLSKIHPLVRKSVVNAGYHYHEEGYLHCLKKCLDNYDEMFRKPQNLL